jgi:NADPH-dependent curcumin reductase CurA
MQHSQAPTPAQAGASWPATYTRVVLASRPAGLPQPDNFRVEQSAAPALDAGQVRVRNHYLSIDPYMVGRMYESRSYAASTGIGEIMPGETAGQVVESRHPGFAVGDYVIGPLGWQEQAVSDGQGLRRADTSRAPLQAYLGALGMTGVTAWYGMTQICRPEHGSTVVVSAAAGAVGGVAVQLAKARGCRVVGIAGGAAKCAYVTQVLGADACVDYKQEQSSQALGDALARCAPEGFDACFDNVNGWVLDAILPRMNLHGRIALCGMIARYGQAPNHLAAHGYLLISRLRAQGFIVWDHVDLWSQAVDELGALFDEGRLRYQETIAQGIEAAPGACIGLLSGRNTGKQLVRLIDDQ